MSGLTLTQARDLVSKKLNDTAKARYENTAHIDPALLAALETTLCEYADEGGDYLLTEVTGTTDSTGELDITADAVLLLRYVRIVDGTSYYPINRMGLGDGYTELASAKSLSLYGVTVPTLDTGTPTNPLYDHAHAWKTFDKLVAVRAALELSGNEDRARPALVREEMQLWDKVLKHRIPGGPQLLPLPRTNLGTSFIYKPDTQAIQLVRSRGRR